jgi:hypothetical protein
LEYLAKSLVKPFVSKMRRYRRAERHLPPPDGAAWGFWGTKNQKRAIDAFSEMVDHRVCPVDYNDADLLDLPVSILARSAMDSSWYAARMSSQTDGAAEWVRLLRASFNASLQFHGWLKAFAARRPAFVLLANDHTMICRAIAHAARCNGVTVGYVQHASVTEQNPSLRCFDVAFLDGQHAEDVYQKKDGSGHVVFVKAGAIRNARLHSSRARRTYAAKTVGIAVNQLTTAERLRSLLRILETDSAYERILVRAKYPEQMPVTITGPGRILHDMSNSIEEFIGEIDVLICGSTSTPMEAIAAGVPCLYHQLEDDVYRDYYGFAKSGLIQELTSLDDLLNVMAASRKVSEDQRRRFGHFDQACIDDVEPMRVKVQEYFCRHVPQK